MAVPTLQIPGYAAPTTFDFSPLANLGKVYQQAQQDAVRKQTLAGLGQGNGPLDYGDAARKLLAVGDTQAAMSLASLGNSQRDFSFRQQEAQRAQGNADRSFGLQQAASERAGADKFQIVKVENPDGTTSYARVNTRGPEGPVQTGPQPGAAGAAPAGNPFGGGKFNGDQGKAAGFTDRMLQSEAILGGKGPETGIGPEAPGLDVQGSSFTSRNLSKIPLFGNYAVGEDYQKYSQAKADFINAQLRRESGAAISPSEFENAERQYFPVPGDPPKLIEQKRANRRAAVKAMGREGGPSYRPEASFRSDGVLVPTLPNIAPAQQDGQPSGRISSKAQFDALPSGTKFIAPDGSERIKP